VAVLLAAASTEAFINEFTESVLLYKKSRNCQDGFPSVRRKLAAAALQGSSLEADGTLAPII
jgi:hypothetical protein